MLEPQQQTPRPQDTVHVGTNKTQSADMLCGKNAEILALKRPVHAEGLEMFSYEIHNELWEESVLDKVSYTARFLLKTWLDCDTSTNMYVSHNPVFL